MFALASLPYIPFKNITDRMTPFERVKLAISREAFFHRLAQSTAEVAKYTVNLEKKFIEVKFGDEKNDFKLTFDKPTTSASTLYVSTSSVGVLNVLRRLQNLFNGPVDQLTVDLKTIDEAVLERLPKIKCEKLVITGNTRKISKRKVADLLKKIHATKEIHIESDLGTRFSPVPPADKIVLKNATGTVQADLLALGGKTRAIEILESELTAKDVNAFIQKWFAGTERITSFVKISREDEEEWSLTQVLKGLPSEKFDKDSRDRRYITSRAASGLPLKAQDMGSGLDIQRADGLMATVCAAGSVLYFCVWHDQHEVKNQVAKYTQESLDAQNRLAQHEEASDAMEQRILENVQRIEATMRQIEEMEMKISSIALEYFLKSLKADVKALETENQKIQEDIQETASKITEAREENIGIIETLGALLLFL